MERLRYLTAGESHGRGLVGILEGMPANVPITQEFLNKHLKRRQQGYGRGGRQIIETDEADVITGIRFGKTLGSPIAIAVWNNDWKNWSNRMDVWHDPGDIRKVTVPRPGHADLSGALKYGHDDIRNVLERASARETAVRVALGSVARQFLEHLGIIIASHVVQIRDITSSATIHDIDDFDAINDKVDQSEVRCLDADAESEMIARIKEAMTRKDTVGGVFEIVVKGLPIGIGSHVHWERKLDARIAEAMMSIQAMKGVGIGLGFEAGARWGSDVHDAIYHDDERGWYRKSTGSGGTEGGMSTGEPLIVRVAMKPISTLMQPLDSVDLHTKEKTEAHIERSDVCAVPAASVIGEAVLALTIADAMLEKFGGDFLEEVQASMDWYRQRSQ
jgi:chorismate synthase